jgi:hypothetical protein
MGCNTIATKSYFAEYSTTWNKLIRISIVPNMTDENNEIMNNHYSENDITIITLKILLRISTVSIIHNYGL